MAIFGRRRRLERHQLYRSVPPGLETPQRRNPETTRTKRRRRGAPGLLRLLDVPGPTSRRRPRRWPTPGPSSGVSEPESRALRSSGWSSQWPGRGGSPIQVGHGERRARIGCQWHQAVTAAAAAATAAARGDSESLSPARPGARRRMVQVPRRPPPGQATIRHHHRVRSPLRSHVPGPPGSP